MNDSITPGQHDTDPSVKPLMISNESLIAGESPNWLEKVSATTDLHQYWPALAEAMPAEAEIYSRNQSLLGLTRDVIAGDRPATGKLDDIRDRCELFFSRLGSCNALTGKTGREDLISITGRYLELSLKDQPVLDKDSVRFADLPAYLVTALNSPESRDKAFNAMRPRQRAVLGTMLYDVAQSFGDSKDLDKDRAKALRNRFEDFALATFISVNKSVGQLSSVSAPNFLADIHRRSWGHIYDIQYNKVARIADPAERQTRMTALIGTQAQETIRLLNAKTIVTNRPTDGWLYEYFLPTVVRYSALKQGQEDKVMVRRALPREDQPIDGMTHPELTEELEKYSFDFLLQYPDYKRRVFLQTKIGTHTEGYDPDISVFNHHARIPDLRTHMKNVTSAILRDLSGIDDPKYRESDKKILHAELLRVSSLLPEEASK